MEGRLAVDWRLAQARYWLRHGCMKSVRRWATALVLRLLAISWDFWDHRNHVLYGMDVSLADFILDSHIQMYYTLGPAMAPPHCRQLFAIPLPRLLRSPWPFKWDWLNSVQIGRAAQLRASSGSSAISVHNFQ
jgi:hypothetical protein